VLGSTRGVTYLEVDGFVVVVTEPGTPLLPNSVSGSAEGALTVWDPTLSPASRSCGHRLLAAFSVDPAEVFPDREGAHGVARLLASVSTGDAVQAREGLESLIGRGRGLTPEGDDFVAGAVAVVAATGAPHPLLEELGRLDLRGRTSLLSATLLELAAAAQVPEPLQRAFAGDDHGMSDLFRLGHSTGRVYALGAAAAAVALPESAGLESPDRRIKTRVA
jgi:hypothetical protein